MATDSLRILLTSRLFHVWIVLSFATSIKEAIINKADTIKAYVVNKGMAEISLTLGDLTDDERDIILAGCLINYYKEN